MYTQVLAGNKSPGVSRIPGPSGIPAPGSSQLRRPSGGASSSTSPKLRQSKLASKSSGRSPPTQRGEKVSSIPTASAGKGGTHAQQPAAKEPVQVREGGRTQS